MSDATGPGPQSGPRLGPGLGPRPGPLLGAVLAALRSGPDAGALALWAALDDGARAPWRDEDGARRALDNPLWSPLVAHAHAATEPWDHRGPAARTLLTVVDGKGSAARYLVSARLGPDGTWRLTGLRRDDLPWD